MTKEEFKPVAKLLKAVYTDPRFLPDQYAYDTWFALLRDLPYELVVRAAKDYMQTSTFAPTVADIRKRCARNLAPAPMQGVEAWGLVARALRNGYYGAAEEYAKLPPLVREAVGSPAQLQEWAAEDSTKVHTIEQSHFIRSYEAIVARHKEDAPLPESIAGAITSRRQAAELRDRKAKEAEEALESKNAGEIEAADTRATPDQVDAYMARWRRLMRDKMA